MLDTKPTNCRRRSGNSLPFDDVYGLRPFITLGDFKFDILAFIEGLKSISIDRAVMNKHITATLFLNKAVTFCVIEPFDLP